MADGPAERRPASGSAVETPSSHLAPGGVFRSASWHPRVATAAGSEAHPPATDASPRPDTVARLPPDPPDPPEYDVRAIEKRVHRLVNQERTEHRMPALEWVDSLRTLGVVHSRDMRDRDFFRHTNPDGETINDRADTLGLHCRRIDGDTVYGFGENLYKATLYIQYRDFYEDSQFLRREYEWKTESSIAREIVDGWMDSPGHRQNILTQGYDVEAIGIVADRKRFYVTQVFC
jgi:uncharacterized protein YkwD